MGSCHSDIIDMMGGSIAVARAFGISCQAVTKWRRSGIPSDKMKILSMAHTLEGHTDESLRPIIAIAKMLPPDFNPEPERSPTMAKKPCGKGGRKK